MGSSFPSDGSTSRKRHTPLWSCGRRDERRSRQIAFNVAALSFSLPVPGWGKTTSSKSPHLTQFRPDSATGVTAPQPMQRSRVSSSCEVGAINQAELSCKMPFRIADHREFQDHYQPTICGPFALFGSFLKYSSVLPIQSARGG